MIKRLIAASLMMLTAAGFAQDAKYVFKNDLAKKEISMVMADGNGSKPVWTYHFDPKDNHPYFSLVSAPGGGNMAAVAPGDHLWHKGLWFSWKWINDVNFWDWTEAHGNHPKWPARPPRTPEGWSKATQWEFVQKNGGDGVMEMTLGYGVGDKTWIKEARRLAFGLPDSEGNYVIDWRSTFTAQEKVKFDVSPVKPNTGGYAGLGLRSPVNMKDVVFTNSLGTTGQACRGQKASWVDMTAVVDPAFGPEGVTIFDHPENPRHPTPWHVQATPPFYYFNAALLYNEPLTLDAGKSLTLRYRILVHKGKMGAEKLNQELEKFSKVK